MKFKWILILSFPSVWGQNVIVSDTTPIALNEVVLTANRVETKIDEVTLPIQLISQKQIQNSGLRRLDELLNEQTGITIITDQSGFKGLQMQGVNSQYIMILVDGLPLLGRNSGNLDLSRLAVGNIEKVEIVKGPASSLYGSEALGGVINIITKKAKSNQLSGNVNYSFGTFDTHESNLNIQQKKGDLGFALYLNTMFSEGYDLDKNLSGNTVDPFRNATLGGNLSYSINEDWSLNLNSRAYYQTIEVAGDNHESDLNAGLISKNKWSKAISTETELYYSIYDADQQSTDPISDEITFESQFKQQLFRPELRLYTNISEKYKVVSGIGYTTESLERNVFANQVSFNAQYAYTQFTLKTFRDLTAQIGARFDHHSEYASQFSPKASAVYKISKNISLKSSIGRGFKAPDFRQLYLDFTNSTVGYTVVGKRVEQDVLNRLIDNNEILEVLFEPGDLNQDLEAESSVGINIGLDLSLKKLDFNVNAFRNDFKDMIDTQIIARKNNGQNVFGYVNRDEIYTTGVETNLNYKPFENFDVSLGYQLLYAKDKAQKERVDAGLVFVRDAETLQTTRISQSDYFGLPNRSRHLANLKLNYEIPHWNSYANLRINYRSKFALFDTNGNGLIDKYDDSFVDGFATLNLSLGKTILDKYKIQLNVINLFNNVQTGLLNVPGIQFNTRIQYQF